MRVTVLYETDGGPSFEDEYTIRAFKQFSDETQILQFWAVAGGLRTIHRDRIINIRPAPPSDRKYIGRSVAELRAMGVMDRERKRK